MQYKIIGQTVPVVEMTFKQRRNSIHTKRRHVISIKRYFHEN